MTEAASPFDVLDAITRPLSQVMVLREIDRWGVVPDEERSTEAADGVGLHLGVTPRRPR